MKLGEPVFSIGTYFSVWAALLCLVLATVLIGYLNLGWGSMFIAVAIATIKAGVIASFFMHAIAEKKIILTVIAGAIVWFMILVTLTLGDYISRGWLGIPGR